MTEYIDSDYVDIFTDGSARYSRDGIQRLAMQNWVLMVILKDRVGFVKVQFDGVNTDIDASKPYPSNLTSTVFRLIRIHPTTGTVTVVRSTAASSWTKIGTGIYKVDFSTDDWGQNENYALEAIMAVDYTNPSVSGKTSVITASSASYPTESFTVTWCADTCSASPLTLSSQFDWKQSVRVGTTANLAATRSGNVLTASSNGTLAAIDDITLIVGDRILVKNQTTGADNGIYTVTSLGAAGAPWTMTRAVDADSNDEVTSGLYVLITEGTANAGSSYVLSTPDPITLNTTSLTFTQFTGVQQLVAGDGLTRTGNRIDVVLGAGLEIAADAIKVKGVDESTYYVARTARNDQKPTLTVREFDGAPSFEATVIEGVNGGVAQGSSNNVARLYFKPIDQVTTIDAYKRANGAGNNAGGAASEAFTTIATPQAPPTLYVREGTSGTNGRLTLKGKCSPAATRSNFQITWNGNTYVEGTGADAGYIVLQSTSTRVGVIDVDFTDVDGFSKARWYFGETAAGSTSGITAVAPGTEATRSFVVQSDGQGAITASIIVDRTAPSISSFTYNGMSYGQASGTPMYRGEYIRWTWASADSGAGLAATPSAWTYPDGTFITSAPSTGAASGTTSYLRTSSGAPTSVTTRRATMTVTDQAGNAASSDLTFYFTTLPATPTATLSITSSNQSPYTVFNSDHGTTSYDDDTIVGNIAFSAQLAACRNSSSDNSTASITAGASAGLSVSSSPTIAVTGVLSVTGLTATVSSQSSNLGRTLRASVTDQFYQTFTSADAGNFDYNAQKTNDLDATGGDPSYVSPFGGLNKVTTEGFHDADTTRITNAQATSAGKNTTSNAKIEDGYAKKTATGGQVVVKFSIPTNRGTNNQYGIKARGATGELSASDGITIEWSPTGANTWTTQTLGSVFTGPTGATALDVRITFGASTPDVEALYLAYIE